MIAKRPAPDLIRGGTRFSEKHALGLDPRDHAAARQPDRRRLAASVMRSYLGRLRRGFRTGGVSIAPAFDRPGRCAPLRLAGRLCRTGCGMPMRKPEIADALVHDLGLLFER